MSLFHPNFNRLNLRKYVAVPLVWLSLLGGVQAQTTPEVVEVIASVAERLPAAQADSILKAQHKQSNRQFLKNAVLPSAVLIAAGIYTIKDNGFYSSYDAKQDARTEFPHFSTKIDDYIFFVPMVGLYGFNLFSSQNKHDIRRQTGLLLASGALATAIIYPTKILSGQERPNGLPRAFPSGHTAYAFTIATIADKEFRDKSPWISVGAYTIASATGVMRVLNNEHWMSDVLAGAGIGILSVNTVYWLHDKFARNKGLNARMAPTILPNGQLGMGLAVKF
ncbi:phosphatase PAP2 family protein [Nibribacter ruber]|uniref:Phosphatase PAP2 family protein n=1 Tax=Nibribacter ruber TaxID=2698458 RepID=A0A6P1P1L5_9BACT|nr:phosphatase PAP2 family protein [Nibribacter ruber]